MTSWEDLEASASRVDGLPPDFAARDEEFWEVIQQAFNGNRALLNLNNGGVCPSPEIVTDALCRYSRQQEDVPTYTMWQILEPQTEEIRTGLAAQFGCDREEIAITRNASESLETLLFGIDLKPGDEILATTQEYPRMLTAIRQRERRDGVALRLVSYPTPPRSSQDILDAIASGITPRTRVILVSHVVFLTGQITPVKEICELGRSKGIEVIVDGAHSFAHLDFKQQDLGCDYFCASLHKWLYAPKGTGFLFVRREKIESVWPLMAAEPDRCADIRKFEETGTRSAATRLAIAEALRFHRCIGAARKEARLRLLRDRWAKPLSRLPNVSFYTRLDDKAACGIATMGIDGVEPETLQSHLFAAHRIFTVAIAYDQIKGIRITPNVYTTLAELDRYVGVMERIARHGLPK